MTITLKRRAFVAGCLAFGFAAGLSMPVAAANVAGVMRGNALRFNGTVVDLEPLKKFYRSRLGRAVWTGKKGLSKDGVEAVQVLQNAGADGLSPSDYLSALPANVQQLTGKELAGVELYISQSLWRFARDLAAGRTTPSVSEPDIVISRKRRDVTSWLKIAQRSGPDKLVSALRPKHPQYAALIKLLASTKPGSARARQIIVNMERWRWLPVELGKRHVLVNQASFEMRLYEKGKVSDRRRVVVGKPYHKTPMFSHAISYAEFNPTWTVPLSIAKNEMLPKIKKDPGYLTRNNYKLHTSWKADAPAMNPEQVDWSGVRPSNFNYRIVQQPGDNNALGQVKFLFPNKFNVYLHDTQSKNLFKKSERAFSHGCIRVDKPLEFAEKLFGTRALSQRKIQSILSDPRTQRVNLKKPVPVHLAYFTVWVEGGTPSFHKDIYGRDKLVGRILFGRA